MRLVDKGLTTVKEIDEHLTLIDLLHMHEYLDVQDDMAAFDALEQEKRAKNK